MSSLSQLQGADILVLLKIAACGNLPLDSQLLSLEMGLPVIDIESSLERLKRNDLLNGRQFVKLPRLREYILYDLPLAFPTKPGKLSRGMLTGAKPGFYFTGNLPYASIWVWPKVDGKDEGFEISPLSPNCCFAAMNDRRLRTILGVTETMRVAGSSARDWVAGELERMFRI